MSQRIPIYIPTYINSAEYAPARVLPRLFFYNGLVDCENYWIESGSLAIGGVTYEQSAFPYFDNYNVVTGSFPSTGSRSLLFNNEQSVYGTMPNGNLYTEYWETYINLLYNPKTRLIECAAIIPLADYVNMELNDVVNFRGNYYHLRAINDYSLKTGDCNLQLLGPIIPDTFTARYPTPPITLPATALINLSEYNGSPTAFIDGNIIVDGTPYYFSGNFTQSIAGNTVANVTMEGKDGGSTVWGPYTTASATLTTYNNGAFVTSSTKYIYSGSGDVTITFPTTFNAGNNITISGSTNIVTSPITGYLIQNCSSSVQLKVSFAGGIPTEDVFVSSDLFGGCWQLLGTTTGSLDYTNIVNDGEFVDCATCLSPTGSANLAWSYSETGGANGYMDLYVNGSIVESRSNTASGTRTVYVGDTINVEVNCQACGGFDNRSNAYCTGIIDDADCKIDDIANIFTAVYTVQLADVGTTLNLDTFAACAGGCL